MRPVLLLLPLLVAGCPTPAPPPGGDPPTPDPSWEDLSETLESAREEADLPALGAVRIFEGSVTHLGTTGLRKVDEDIPVTDDDLWHLGSCTKAMTAALTATYVDDGLLSWESTLSELLPDLTGMHEDYRDVTVAMLLGHQGGTWGSLLSHPDLWDMMGSNEGTLMEKRFQVAESVLSEAPEVSPGTTLLYSNAGYIIVGSALESLIGSPWEELMEERLFAPLDMGSCGFGIPDVDEDVSQPWGHYDGDTPFLLDNPPAFGPAGTVHCSLEDWSHFAAAMISGASGTGNFVSEAQFARLFTDQGFGYSMGWGILSNPIFGSSGFVHSGSNTTNYAEVWLAPDLESAVLAVTNSYRSDGSTTEAIQQLLANLIDM